MYARETERREFTFGVSGKLIRNVLVMYDRQTESYWSQLLGEAVAGEMTGTKLTFLPSWLMTWEQWQERHPDTVALDKNGRRGRRDTYDGYYTSPDAGVIGRTNLDERLYAKEFVIGVELADAAVAYPFGVLNEEPVVNDVVAGQPLLVVFDPAGATGVVYERLADGQTLTFAPGATTGRLTDAETGSMWDSLSGAAIAGPLTGQTLRRVKSTISFWFGWVDFHPNTAIYSREE